MRLFELFEKEKTINKNDFLKKFKDVDSTFNPEAQKYKNDQHEYYKKMDLADTSYTSIYRKPEPADDSELWTTQPDEDVLPSPGYSGRENAKRRAGIPYDKNIQHEDPHSNPGIDVDEQEIIKQAKRRLGRSKQYRHPKSN